MGPIRLTFAAQPVLSAAVGYLLLALAAGLLVAAVVLLRVLHRRSPETPEAEARQSPSPQAAERASSLSSGFAHASDAQAVASTLIEEVIDLLGVEFAAVAMISEDEKEATGLVARNEGEDVDWWPSTRLDLETEPSAIASAAFEASALTIFDVESSPRVNRRLAERVGAKSAAFVPVVSGPRVLAVLVAASTSRRRAFPPEEMVRLEALAGETALALEKAHSAAQLQEALVRERLVAAIGERVRSEHDVEAVLRVAVEEVGKATDVARCFIRLGEPGEPMPIRAEWDAPGIAPIGEAAPNLPAANLAVRKRRTVAAGDVEHDPELQDPSLGRVETLLGMGTKAVLATPIEVFDRVIGVFGLHRSEQTEWTQSEISLAEAVSREVGLALHTAQLLEENRRRLDRQAALVQAAQVMTSELQVETVLQRLVVEVTKLLEADAADCYLLDSRRGVLRCAAVYGLPADLIEFEFPADFALAGEAMRRRQAVVSGDYGDEVQVPHPAYEGFTAAMVAPMTWWGDVRGVLGVGSNDPNRRFSTEDLEVLEAFASLGSVALRNVASIEQSSRQVRIQRGFFRIASVLAQPLSLDETLDAVAQAASEALGGSFAAVLMPANAGLRLAGSHELPPAAEEFLAKGLGGAEPLQAAASRKRVVAAPQLAEDDRFGDDWRGLADAVGFRSLIAVPVEAPRREQTGIGLVFFAEEQAFSDDEIELSHHLAAAARGALERAELFEAERRNRAIAQQLARTGTLLASELDPEAILEEIVEQAPGLVGADAATVSVLEGDDLVVSAAHGEGAETAIGSRVSAVGELAGEVVQSRGPVAVGDAPADGLLSGSDALLEAGYAAYLGAPLVGPEGVVHGVLAVYARGARSWREEEVEALAALAGNVSAFLSNAELYQRVVLERERSMAILGNVADGIVAVDREGCVVLWNAAAEEITNVPAAEAMGRTPADVLQRSLDPDETSAEGRGLIQIRRAEEEVWLSVSEAVMRDPAGAVAGRIYAFRDVSSDRLVEQLKSGFVSTVSHELRAPLTSIYGFAETLLREDVAFGDEERRTFLGYIATEAQRLTEIVDTLLSVARLEAGDLQVQLATTDLREVVSDVVESAEREVANGRRFVLEMPEEPLAASADREKVRQILANLVDNAVKFSPWGGTVTVAARRTHDAVQVRVVDEGTGVPQSEQERIFRKFYRAEDVTSAGGGTGLGLFIARGLASAMGGRVWVDSDTGQGGCFVFELPMTTTEASESRV
ncbi:MAG TPA: GAF domain-containing protein [Gaiellaceae bacterium]|nr:GAF domain-containing protein [Gaiellaceae bacterium]